MQETLRTMREKRADGDRGFTLIELLVVVVILGVLVGIAVPVYLNYRKGAENKAAQSDVRNLVTVVEQCYTENNGYPTAISTSSGQVTITGCAAGKANASDSVTLTYTVDATAGTYVITGKHSNGGVTYTYTSSTGQTTKS